ncbi:unnamed protein product, partial [Anisakis simplex]|uniref:G_PROTEIN_RECEP_F1_2 domain-containing protein n=1 Tax=Anisakis simplex TaxID=6269 RepID=A0A0M3KC09_ANISI
MKNKREASVHSFSVYTHIHKYLSLLVSLFGIVTNTIHIMVLNQSNMRQNAVNRLLSLMGMCDVITQICYLIFTIRFSFMVDVDRPPFGFHFVWICFLLMHVISSIALRTVSIYICVITAYIRYHVLRKLHSKWIAPQSA